MAKFTVTLYEIGDRVEVVAGDFAGAVGAIANWGHIGSREQDVMHYITLDKPRAHTAIRETVIADNKKVVEKEEVTLDTIEARASELKPA